VTAVHGNLYEVSDGELCWRRHRDQLRAASSPVVFPMADRAPEACAPVVLPSTPTKDSRPEVHPSTGQSSSSAVPSELPGGCVAGTSSPDHLLPAPSRESILPIPVPASPAEALPRRSRRERRQPVRLDL